jgi:DeoR/GlpR family transcriptional regulator of sugar metabolism
MLADLKSRGAIRIVEQAELYGVTPETVRRDIETLSNEGKLVRTYGGAIVSSIAHEPSASARAAVKQPERLLIAYDAARLIDQLSVIMIDGGSTTEYFASELSARCLAEPKLVLTIITNSYDVARALSPCTAIRVIMCPGDFDVREQAVFGSRTIEFISEFTADAVVFSAGGISEDGVMDVHSMAAWVKRAMIRQADKAVLLADDGKFGIRQIERVCELAAIDHLVTNAEPPAPLAAALTSSAVEVHYGAVR